MKVGHDHSPNALCQQKSFVLNGWYRLAFLLLSLFSAIGIGKPQEKPAAHQVRVRTSEVIVDVGVTDRYGVPIQGFKESDFEVYEDSIKQQIASFRPISKTSAESGPSPMGGQGKITQPSVLSPDALAPPHLVSIVFDKVNMGLNGLRAEKAANAYVQKYLRKEDMAAVYAIGQGVQTLQRFTGDQASLVDGIHNAIYGNTSKSADVAAEIRTALASIPSGGAIPGVSSDDNKMELAYSADFETRVKYPALQDLSVLLLVRDIARDEARMSVISGLLSIISSQKAITGRKSLIFLSTGFTGSIFTIGAVTTAANRAGVTIFCIDVAGLRAEDPDSERRAAQNESIGGRNVKSIMHGIDSMGLNTLYNLGMLSEDTGGYIVKNTNDLVEGMQRIGAYIGQYYVLTYAPSNPINDAKYRSISVKVKRSGLTVSARKGYYAIPDTDRVPILGFEAELLPALNAKAPPNQFPIYVGGYSFPGLNEASTAALFVQFSPSKFKIQKNSKTNTYEAGGDVLVLVRDSDRSVVFRLSQQYIFQDSLDNLENNRKKDFSFVRRVPLAPGNYVLEAVVRDRGTGDVSVRKAEFKIGSSDQNMIQPRMIILGKRSVQMAGSEKSENPFRLENPLHVEEIDFTPHLSGVYHLSSDKELIAYFATTRHSSAQIQATFEIVGNGTPTLKLQRILPEPDATANIRSVTPMDIGKLKPGKYELRVTTTDASGSTSSTATFFVER